MIEALERAGVRYWVDGGWGVDALLGEETRPHSDLDLVVLRLQAAPAEQSLAALGFVHAPEVVPGLPARFVLRRQQEQIDLHLIVMDSLGNGWQELDGNAWGLYPAEGLRAEGTIGGRRVPCITPELQPRLCMEGRARSGHEPACGAFRPAPSAVVGRRMRTPRLGYSCRRSRPQSPTTAKEKS